MAGKFVVLLLIVGFVPALIFAWAFEMTPEGIKREKDVERGQSITGQTGRKLDFTIIAILVVGICYLLVDKFWLEATPEAITNNVAAITPTPATPSGPKSTTIHNGSIAVLPFANRSDDKDDVYFTDGIHDDLLTQLAKIQDLKVISRTSVMKYKDTQKTIPEIARELGVTTILEGGIQRAGKRIRINAQLIDVSNDQHLWAETFDREMTVENIFDIQSEIARQIVQAVRGELTEEEADVLTQLPTHNLEAYEAYLHARKALNTPDYVQEKFEAAEQWFNKAVEYDPEFALAWAGLVGMHAQAIWLTYDDSPKRYEMIREALRKATEYGAFLPETLAARAEYLYRIEGNFHEAEIALRAASKAQPGDSSLRQRLALALRRTGKWEESISNFQLAVELDPENLQSRTLIIETLLNMGEYERAEPLINLWVEKYPQAMDIQSYKVSTLIYHHGNIAAARNLLDQLEPSASNPYFFNITVLPFLEREYEAAINVWDHPHFAVWQDQPWYEPSMLETRSRAYHYAGDTDRARDLAQQAVEEALKLTSNNDNNRSFDYQTVALAYLRTGEIQKALDISEQALNLMPESRDSINGPFISSIHARILGIAGQRDEALAEIERLLDTPAGLNRWDLYLNPDWDFFRDDERFNELIRPLNLEETGK
jgi:TolB-like protein/Tfp pilus assembly protein PilF